MKKERTFVLKFAVGRVEGMTWHEFTVLMDDQWHYFTWLANSIVHHLLRNDFSPMKLATPRAEGRGQDATSTAQKPEGADDEQEDSVKQATALTTYPGDYDTYTFARELAPTLDTQSLGSTARNVTKDYMRKRRGALLYGNDSLPLYRFPYKVPCQSKDYELSKNEAGLICVTVKLGRLPVSNSENAPIKPRKVTLVLCRRTKKREPDFSYKTLNAYLLKDPRILKVGALAITRAKVNKGDNRACFVRRDKARNRQYFGIQVNFAVTVPCETNDWDNVALVHTDPEHFISCRLPSRVWTISDDHLRDRIRYHYNKDVLVRLVSDHERRMARLAQDCKFDAGAKTRTYVGNHRTKVSEKQSNRILDALHKLSKQLVERMVRSKVGVFYYNDQSDGFIPHFPWALLRTMIMQKAEAFGIEYRPLEVDDIDNVDWDDEYLALRGLHTAERREEASEERERAPQAVLTH